MITTSPTRPQIIGQTCRQVVGGGLPGDVVFAINPARTGHLRDLVTGYDPVPDCSFPGTVRIVDPDTGEIRTFESGGPAVVPGRGYFHTGPSTNMCLSSEDKAVRSLMNGAGENEGRYIIPSQGYVALWASHFSTGPIAVGDSHTIVFVGVTGSGRVSAVAGRGDDRTSGPATELSDKPQNIAVSHKWARSETSIFAWLWGVDDSIVSPDFKVICIGKPYWDGAYIPTVGSVVSRPSRAGGLKYGYGEIKARCADILSGSADGTILVSLRSVVSTRKSVSDPQAGIYAPRSTPYRGVRDDTNANGTYIFQGDSQVATIAGVLDKNDNIILSVRILEGKAVLKRFINGVLRNTSAEVDAACAVGDALYFFVGAKTPYELKSYAISERTDISEKEFTRYL